MRNLFRSSLAILLILASSMPAYALSDVTAGTLEGNAALYLQEQGIVNGFPDGEFKGQLPVNRAEAAKFLLLSRGITVTEQSTFTIFSDVPSDAWFAAYVDEANRRSIIKGYSDGTYRPANQISTAEFLKMVGETFQLTKNLPHDYVDTSQNDPNSSWYWQYAGAAQDLRLFPSRQSFLNPSQPLTRAEVAMGLYQYLRRQSPSEDSVETPSTPNTPNTPTTSNKTVMVTQMSVSTAPAKNDLQAVLKFSLQSDAAFTVDTISLEAEKPDSVSVLAAEIYDSKGSKVAETSETGSNTVFTLDREVSANVSLTLTVYADINDLFLNEEITFYLPKDGITGSFADGSALKLDKGLDGLSMTSMTPREVNYEDAPPRIQVEGGYIAYEENPQVEALALDFNFRSPSNTSYWEDIDIRADTSRLGEFIVMIRQVPADGERIVIDNCNIIFQSGGGNDNACGDGTATIDTGSYPTPSTIADYLTSFSGFSNHNLELAVSGSVAVRFTRTGSPVDGNLLFADFTNGKVIRMIKAVGRSSANNPLNAILSSAELRINGKIIADAINITADRIQFRDMNYRLAADQTYDIEVIPFPKRVGSGGAQSGQAFVLSVVTNSLSSTENGKVLSPAGTPVVPGVKATSGNQIVVAQTVPVIEAAGPVSSNFLSVGTHDFLNFRIDKVGEGSVEVGAGLPTSQFQIRLFKSSGVAVDSCEIRDSTTTLATAKANPNDGGTFYLDAYGKPFGTLADVTNAQVAYVTFTPNTFSGGKRLEATGKVFSIYCSVTTTPASSSMQASIDLSTELSFIENNNDNLPLSDSSLIKKLPINGSSRVTN